MCIHEYIDSDIYVSGVKRIDVSEGLAVGHQTSKDSPPSFHFLYYTTTSKSTPIVDDQIYDLREITEVCDVPPRG